MIFYLDTGCFICAISVVGYQFHLNVKLHNMSDVFVYQI